MRPTELGSIDGKAITQEEFQSAIRAEKFFQPRASDSEIAQQAINRVLLLRVASNMGIEALPNEVKAYMEKQFTGPGGQYDPATVGNFVKNILPQVGITQERYWDMLTQNTVTMKLREVLTASVQVPQDEVKEQFNQFYGVMKIAVIRINPEQFNATVTVTPEEIKKAYEQGIKDGRFHTEDKRKVEYALIPFPADFAKMNDEEKNKVRSAALQRAEKLVAALVPDEGKSAPDFNATAKAAEAAPGVTGFFGPREPAIPGKATSVSFQNTAFVLTPSNPITAVPVETDDGLYVIKLLETKTGEPKPLEIVKAEIDKELRQGQAMTAALEASEKALATIKERVAAGVPFRAAAAGLKLKVEEVPPFTGQDMMSKRELQAYGQTVLKMKAGEIGPLYGDYGLVVLESRETPDAAKLADFEKEFSPYMLEQSRNFAFENWIRWRRLQPDFILPAELRQRPGSPGQG